MLNALPWLHMHAASVSRELLHQIFKSQASSSKKPRAVDWECLSRIIHSTSASFLACVAYPRGQRRSTVIYREDRLLATGYERLGTAYRDAAK